jgi:hypothetical protein
MLLYIVASDVPLSINMHKAKMKPGIVHLLSSTRICIVPQSYLGPKAHFRFAFMYIYFPQHQEPELTRAAVNPGWYAPTVL